MANKNESEMLTVGGSEEETRKFWRDNAKAMLSDSIGSLEGAAKQIIVVTSLLEGIYFHAITFSEIKKSITIISGIFYLSPFLLWLISLLFASLVFLPRNYEVNINSFRNSKEEFIKIVSYKHKMLKVSQVILFISFVFLLVAMAIYLFSIGGMSVESGQQCVYGG